LTSIIWRDKSRVNRFIDMLTEKAYDAVYRALKEAEQAMSAHYNAVLKDKDDSMIYKRILQLAAWRNKERRLKSCGLQAPNRALNGSSAITAFI
jgi:hypothetical protein